MTIELDGVNNTLKTDKIEPQSGTALQVGASGDTITLPSGATLNIAGTISNSGTATGFGAIDWQTSDVKTSTFTAVAGKGYFVNTTGGAITVNLPAGSAGAQVALADYAGTWDDNNCTVSANGSEKIQGVTDDAVFSRDREALQLVYIDSTQGWIIVSVADQGGTQAAYTVATGGTITTSGDYKIHTFTGDGTFAVTTVGNASGGGAKVSYVVVGGGGAGASGRGGGGGAGGFREGKVSSDPYTDSPLDAGDGLTVSVQSYPIDVGGGGAGVAGGAGSNIGTVGASGESSTFSTITSAGGGYGSTSNGTPPGSAANGGSGGGGSFNLTTAGSGNTPPVSPPQGQNGGVGVNGGNAYGGGGGGGAGGTGNAGQPTANADGGNGVASSITGSPVSRAGGGGGAHSAGPGYPGVPTGTGGGGTGGGGAGGTSPGSAGPAMDGSNGTDNTGGGGGGGAFFGTPYHTGNGGSGGSGVVIIRYKYQN